MNEENIKLGECAWCHNIRKVHRVNLSYGLRFAFLCDECDTPIQNSQIHRKEVKMKKYILKEKGRNYFIYERHNEYFGYDEVIEISFKNIPNGYRGILVTSYQKDCNTDGLNNAIGLRNNALLRLPFMIAHFMIHRIFTRKKGD